MAIAEVSVAPLGTENPSVSKYVASAIKVLQKENDVSYEINPMGTTIEGDVISILRVVGKMHESVFQSGAVRVLTTIKIDDRRDKEFSARGKIISLKEKLD
jgi:uncharacterized protein (TIGR00106 family)